MNRIAQWGFVAAALSISSCSCGVTPFDQLAGVKPCGKTCASEDECGAGYTCQGGVCTGGSCDDGNHASSGGVGASSGINPGSSSLGGGSGTSTANPSSGVAASSSSNGPGSSASQPGASSSAGSGGVSSGPGATSNASGPGGSSASAGTSVPAASSGASSGQAGGSSSGGVVVGSSSGGVVTGSSSGGVVAGSSSGGVVAGSSSGGVVTGSSSGGVVTGSSSGGVVTGSSSGGVVTGSSSSGGAASSSGGMGGSSSSGGGGGSSSSGGGPCVGGYIDVNGSCVVWTVCTAAQYEVLPPTPTSDRVCLPLTVCSVTEFEVTPPTATTDRTCAALTVCTPLQYQSTPPTPTTDRTCAPITTCTMSEYEATPPTATSDRQCLPITSCTATQFEVAPPTSTSNRVCQDLTVCNTIFQYESTPPTATSDRVCSVLTFCTSDQYESTPPTPTSNRVCTALTVCGVAQCQTVAPTATTDRVCGPLVLDLTPAASQTLVVTNPASPPTLTFESFACGSPITAGWTVDQGALGSLASALTSSNVFTPSGTAGGLVTVIAGYQGVTARRQVLIQLAPPVQNGPNGSPAETAQVATNVAVLTTGGGVGGVGGEGLGVALAAGSPTLVALQGTPTVNNTLQLLYPYNDTVWPRGMLAPLLQWTWDQGDADGVRIELSTTTGSYSWTGYFGRPAILASLGAAFRRFIRIPIPQDVWEAATNSAGGPTLNGLPDRLTVRLTVARNGVAYGPVTQTWTVAPARLSGTIYYQSYGTNLANNYTGAQGTPTNFGAAVLSIRGGDTNPLLVSSFSNCQVCHSVASRGGRLVVQAETNSNGDTWAYELTPSGVTGAMLARGIPSPGYPGLYPDGSLMLTPRAALQPLPDNSGADIPTTGLTTVSTRLGVPAFSPNGTKVVFNPQNMVSNAGRKLMVMDFDVATKAFTNPIVVINETGGNNEVRPAWPQFFPTGNALIYQQQLEAGLDGNQGDAHTRKFARGELYFAPAVASATAVPLNRLNGRNADNTSYLPNLSANPSTLNCTADNEAVGANGGVDGDTAHVRDASYNYEPTVNPVSSGGYAWVVFTSRRLYGNVATIPPFCSDPRGVDLHANMINNGNITTKKLWVAAIDLNAAPGTDGSHPAFYLPAQELLAGNARGFWVLDPCRADNASCLTGDQCCNGYCQPNGVGGALVCSDRPPDATCSNLQEACASAQDCCLPTAECINNFCAEIEQ